MSYFLKPVNLLIIALIFMFSSNVIDGQNRKSQKYTYKSSRNYEIVMLGVGSDGTKVFKIFATEKKVEKAIALAKKAAVEMCIFRGLPASGTISGTPALCTSEDEEKNQDFFDEFFTPGGKYLNYVNITNDGYPSGQDRLKIKGGYKVGLTVQVLYDNLRGDLEREGVVKPLNYGF
jgi:hypothetical protein